MKTWKKLLLCLAIGGTLASCETRGYKVVSEQEKDDYPPYESWNWLPNNS
jgi:hypothetical protein